MDKGIKERLLGAKTLDEVKEILRDEPKADAERIYQELERHLSKDSELLDLEELDAISGSSDRDWVKEGCAATCEENSWCWSSDWCNVFDVTYDSFWAKCPDGHDHVYDGKVCVRCGHRKGGGAVGPA